MRDTDPIFEAALTYVRDHHPGRWPVRITLTLNDGNSEQITLPPRHGPDFRSVNWFGQVYTFTPAQAAIVKILWLAWEQGTAEVSQEYLVTETGIETDKLSVLFRGCPAWGKMIVAGESRGTLRLAE